LFGLFDRWAQSLLRPGQHFFTGTAFANGAMRRVKQDGGLAFLDSWTTHPEDHWNLVAAEQKRWGSRCPPASRCYQDRAVESVAVADYIFTESTFVRQTYLKRGFDPQRVLLCPLPVDLSLYQPAPEARPANRPFTILQTGGLSLRKGTPYLLEAFRLIRKEVPDAVLRVQRHIRNDVVHVLRRNADLPLEWSGHLDFASHVRRYQTSDLMLFPSVEDGFALVVAEALACGLPVITTTNTGASDLIRPGENGDIVPICDPKALADAALKWWDRIRAGERIGSAEEMKQRLSFQKFEETFIGHLARIGIPSQRDPKPSTIVS
jgi:glycosyltransferase involved in cell wall biosynthesis